MINLGEQKEELLKKSNANLSKTIVPGSGTFTILGMTCRKNDYNNQDGYDVSFELVGEDLTAQGFEGFFIDNEDQSQGRHKGAVGYVKLNQYSYKTTTFPAKGDKPEQTVDRDATIINKLVEIAKIVGKENELLEGTVADIPSLIAKAGEVFKGTSLKLTIAGRKYLDKKNYTKYDLFLAKADKGFVSNEAVGANPTKLQVFNPAIHIIEAKGGSAPAIESFEPVEVEFAV